MKKQLNRWQFVWRHGRDAMYYAPFTRNLTIGLINLKRFPEEGALLKKGDYKGILFNVRYWFPVEIV